MLNFSRLKLSIFLIILVGYIPFLSGQCAPPTAQSANPQTTEIEITWTPGTNADSTYVEYGTPGFSTGAGTTVALAPVFGNYSNNISGLLPQTAYEFCVYDICTNGDTSARVCFTDTTLACPSAGADTALTVCFSAQIINLPSLLNGASSGRGIFMDTANTGALNKGDFFPGQAGSGTYNFLYLLGGAACSTDSAWITIQVDTVMNPGLSSIDTICDTLTGTDLALYLGSNYTAGGSWVDVNSSGAFSGTTFNPSQVSAGSTYTFRYVLPANSCTAADSATIELYIDSCSANMSTQNIVKDAIDIYPNPAGDFLYINNLTNRPALDIKIFSAAGNLVRNINSSSVSKTSLNIQALKRGFYTIQFYHDGYKEVHSFLKK